MSTAAIIEAHPSFDCDECQDYLSGRIEVLPKEILVTARRRNIATDVLLLEFMGGVHRRHTEAHSLAPLPCDCPTCMPQAVA